MNNTVVSELSGLLVSKFGDLGVIPPAGIKGVRFINYFNNPSIALHYAMIADLDRIRTVVKACPWTDSIVKGQIILSHNQQITIEQAADCVTQIWLRVHHNCIDQSLEEYLYIKAITTEFLNQYGAFN